MPADTDRQILIDCEHLKLLSIGYKISSGISALFSVMGLFYASFGVLMGEVITHTPKSAIASNKPPPAFIGWIFVGFGLAWFVVMVAVAAVKWYTGTCLEHRKSRTFCMVFAAIICLGFPYGTILAVFTFIVLGRESVARTFEAAPSGVEPTIAH